MTNNSKNQMYKWCTRYTNCTMLHIPPKNVVCCISRMQCYKPNGLCTTLQEWNNTNNIHITKIMPIRIKIVTYNLTQGFISDCVFHNSDPKSIEK